MAMNSINTNTSSMIALQNLSATQTQLATVQNRINTGLKIGSAKDNGAIWAISQKEQAQSSSLDTTMNSLNNGKSILDTTLQAGSQLTDILTQMRSKALAASDATIDDASRAQYQSEFSKLAQSFANTVGSANFNGVSLIDGSLGQVKALGNADGTITVDSAHKDISGFGLFGAAGLKATAFAKDPAPPANGPFAADTATDNAGAWSDGTGGNAKLDLGAIDTAMTTVTQALSGFGVDSKAMDNQLTLVGKLQDSLNTGIGNLVDANLAQESASLQALQTKQQLGVQALSIANQSTSILLGLFK